MRSRGKREMELLTHEPKPDPEWNESYYFVFANLEHNLRGMTRLGFQPNKKEAMTFFLLFLPDGSVAGYQMKEKIRDYLGTRTLRVGGVVHRPQPDGTWRYGFEGNMIVVENPEDFPKVRERPKLISRILPVSMEVTFTPINDVYEYSEHMTPESLELGRKSGDAHWEQIAMVDGEIRLGDGVFHIRNTLGQRDHTHGVRDWTRVGNWLYYVVWFSEDLAVNPAAIIADDGRISTGGFLFRDGRNIPLRSIRVIHQEFRDGILPVSSELELVDAMDDVHTLEGQAGPIVPIPFTDREGNSSVLSQSFGSFKLDGIPGGYGTFETLRRVRSR